MIQRVQTLYLIGVIITLTTVGFWGNFFDFLTDEAFYYFNANGIDKYTLDGKIMIERNEFPFYFITLALSVFALLVMFSYKNLKKQLTYMKLLWGFYWLLILGIVIWRFFIAPQQVQGEIIRNNFSYDFYILVIGLPFVHLAMVNIGKDKNKIDSANRLR